MNTKRFPITVSLGLFVVILALLGGQTPTSGHVLPAAVAASPSAVRASPMPSGRPSCWPRHSATAIP